MKMWNTEPVAKKERSSGEKRKIGHKMKIEKN